MRFVLLLCHKLVPYNNDDNHLFLKAIAAEFLLGDFEPAEVLRID